MVLVGLGGAGRAAIDSKRRPLKEGPPIKIGLIMLKITETEIYNLYKAFCCLELF